MSHLSWNEVRDRAILFSREHAGDRSESAEKQTFWNDFFHVFGLRRASLASFEANVTNLKGNKGAIDLLWRGKLLVEHKSFGEDLSLAETQAFTYIEDLTRAQRWEEIPRYVLVSDFAQFVLYDLEPDEQRDLPLFDGRKIQPHHFTLAEFPKHVRHFAFMLGQTRVRLDPEDPANEKAYQRMCELHDALKAGGFHPHDLERLLVRVLFCLFAEDTAIFAPDAFTQFIRTQTREDGSDLGARLNELFDWLNNPRADTQSSASFQLASAADSQAGSSRYVDDTDPFAGFRYVNGGLFHERLGFPRFSRDMRNSLLACCDFQWAKISPAVFGSLFQGVMEDRSRRQQGAHYTSERDIMKLLRSLFLDELRAEWQRRLADRSSRRRAEMETFHEKLRSLRFLDPACGCGNFLVLAYRELRALEIEVTRALHGNEQQVLDVRHLLKVDVDQFHGIEYSEWPVRIAEVAMWLMDHQMNAQAAEAFGQSFDRLPLRSSPHIVQGNALRLDWNEVLPREQCSYVLGNPPFIGKAFRNAEQQADLEHVWGGVKGAGVLDYVTCWYVKAARYITDGGRSFTISVGSPDGKPSPEGSRILAGGANSSSPEGSRILAGDADSSSPEGSRILAGDADSSSPEGSRILAGDADSSSPEGSRILAGGVSHRNADENETAPAGAAESPAPRRGASVSDAGSGGSAALHHRLISSGPAGPQSAAPLPRAAFVSTNSISQGEQVGILWGELFQRYRLKIHFAHRTFAWASESRGKAHVHVVIIGFGASDAVLQRTITDYDADPAHPVVTTATNISPYLVEASDVCVFKRREPLVPVEPMVYGSKPVDGGNLLLDDAEHTELLRAAPAAAPFIRPFIGSEEFINVISRWCIWLVDADPASWRHIAPVRDRVENVRRFRLASKKGPTVEQAATPSIFGELRQPDIDYLVVPEVSSENRKYIPMAFVTREVIASNLIYTVPGASIFTFGILTSAMHMAWVRLVAGRLKSDYRYSAGLVYNNFPWPNPTPEQRARVETAARAVLAARAPHLPPRGMSTLADLYDPLTMPAALAKAHAALDRAVEKCYRRGGGGDKGRSAGGRDEPFATDRERVEHLFRLHEQLTAPLLPISSKTRSSKTSGKIIGSKRARTPRLPEAPNQ